MKTFFTITALAALNLCVAQKTIPLKSFTSLAIGPDMEITLLLSDTNKIVINESDEEDVHIQNNEGNLALSGDGAVTVYFTGSLTNIAVGSDAELYCKGEIKVKNLNITAGSDAVITLSVNVKNLQTAGFSDAEITLTGNAEKHNATFKSDAVLNARELITLDTNITLSSDAEASVTATNNVNAKAYSDAELKIYGNPKKVNQSTGDDAEIVVVK